MAKTIKELLGDKFNDNLTPDEIKALLDGEVDLTQLDEEDVKQTTYYKKAKASFDKSISELSQKKKSLQADLDSKLTDEELAKKKYNEEIEAIKKENAELHKNQTRSNYNAKFLEVGFDKEIAGKISDAMVSGNIDDEFFNNFKSQKDIFEKKFKEDSMKQFPKPQGTGSVEKTITKEDFKKMGYEARMQLQEENKALYEELSKG